MLSVAAPYALVVGACVAAAYYFFSNKRRQDHSPGNARGRSERSSSRVSVSGEVGSVQSPSLAQLPSGGAQDRVDRGGSLGRWGSLSEDILGQSTGRVRLTDGRVRSSGTGILSPAMSARERGGGLMGTHALQSASPAPRFAGWKVTVVLDSSAILQGSSTRDALVWLLQNRCDVYLIGALVRADADEERIRRLVLDEWKLAEVAGFVPWKLLFCETERGSASMARQLEPDLHIASHCTALLTVQPFLKHIVCISSDEVPNSDEDLATLLSKNNTRLASSLEEALRIFDER